MTGGQNRPIVWVTRPEPGNGQTCARLLDMGFDARAMPLTKIIGIEPPADLPDISDELVIAVTSANAVRHLPDKLLKQLKHRPLFAVGDATAEAARHAGFQSITAAQGDAGDLAGLLIEETPEGVPILYLAGRTRTGTLEDGLKQQRRDVIIHEIYDVQKVSQITYIKNEIVAERLPGAVLLHSATSAKVLADSIRFSNIDKAFDKTHLFCISNRVKETLPEAWSRLIIVADLPTDQALLDALKRHLDGSA